MVKRSIRAVDCYHLRRSSRLCRAMNSLATRFGILSRSYLTGFIILTSALVSACDTTTSKLSDERARQLQSEGIVRSADDLVFRFTSDPGGRSERREDRRASIVVTRSSLLIHKKAKVGIEVTPRTRREISVQRSGNRIRIRTGTGRSEEIWSFEPPSDPAGWVTDIRNVIKRP